MPSEPSHTRRRAVAVSIGYSPASVCYIPWLISVAGEPALSRLLGRLRSYFGDEDLLLLLNADIARRAIVEEIARPHAANVLHGTTGTLTDALTHVPASYPHVEQLIIFPAAGIFPDCVQSVAMFERHCNSGADLTLCGDPLLDGVLPMILRTSATLPPVSDLAALLRSLRSGPPRSDLNILTYDSSATSGMPAFAFINDRWTAAAADATLSECGETSDSQAAQTFKKHLLSTLNDVPIVPPRTAKKHILYSSARAAFSGGEQSLYTLIANLDPLRYSPAVVFPFDSLLRQKLSGKGIDTEVAGWDYTSITARNIRYCEAVLDAFTPQILHVDALPNPALMVAAQRRNIPVIGHLRVLPGDGISSFTYMTGSIIAVSHFVAERLRRFNVRPDAVHVIHNGVSIPDRSGCDKTTLRRELDIPLDAHVVAVISRLTPGKKLEVFFRALEAAMNSAPQLYVLVVGEASAPFGQYAQDDVVYAAKLAAGIPQALRARIKWIGFHSDVQPIYDASDTLVLTSTQEPFARCMIEGLASGLAIIGPDSGGSVEAIEHGRSGLLFKSDSADDLSAAMLSVIHDKQLHRLLCANAISRARDFSVERHVSNVQSLYDRVLVENEL